MLSERTDIRICIEDSGFEILRVLSKKFDEMKKHTCKRTTWVTSFFY